MSKSYPGGLWVVKKGEDEWKHWRDWLIKHRNAKFFPDHMTVLFQFPPETDEGNRLAKMKLDYFDEQAMTKHA